jgi:uncharacterized membrane protein YfcA
MSKGGEAMSDRDTGEEANRWSALAASGRYISDAEWLDRARQLRADALKASLRRLRDQYLSTRAVLTGAATAGAGAALVFGYAMLLAYEGLPASVLALAAVLLASTVSSIAGFAFSAVSGAMLLRMMNDPVQVVEIMIVCSISIQSFSVALLRRDIDWRRLLPFLAGGVLGLPFGVWVLLHLQTVWFKETMGVLLTSYAAYALLKRNASVRKYTDLTDVCVGFLGGITGGLAGFPGAAVTVWCGMRGWDKRRQRGVNQPFILIMQILALALLATMRGSITRGSGFDLDALEFVPAALLGTWFGLAIFKRLSDQWFTWVVNMLLLISGVGFIV